MKKSLLIWICCLCLLCAGCGQQEETPSQTGTPEADVSTDVSVAPETDGSLQTQENLFVGSWQTEDQEERLYIFLQDGTLEIWETEADSAEPFLTGTYTVSGNQAVITLADGEEQEITAQLTEENAMTMTVDGVLIEFTRRS